MSRVIKEFLLGVYEFRSSVTLHFDGMAYEWGREWAHRLTFRYFE